MIWWSVLVTTGVFLIAITIKGSGLVMTQSFPAAPVWEGMKQQRMEDPGWCFPILLFDPCEISDIYIMTEVLSMGSGSWEAEILHFHLLATTAMGEAGLNEGFNSDFKAFLGLSSLSSGREKWRRSSLGLKNLPVFSGKWCHAMVFAAIWITSAELLRNSPEILRNNLSNWLCIAWAAGIAGSWPLSSGLKKGINCLWQLL